jgi:hypothetical protein
VSGPTYPAAADVAQRIQARIAVSPVAFKAPGSAPQPSVAIMEEIIGAGFWASLLQEEGHSPEISLAYVPPEQCDQPLTFGAWLPLAPDVLAHLSPAVKRPGIHIGVWGDGGSGNLRLWGTTRSLPPWCLVLEVVRPGLVVLKYVRAAPGLKYANVAVLEGSEVKFIEQQDADLTADVPALASLFTYYASAGHREADTVLVRLATSMRTHRCGGTLLVVPTDGGAWRESIVQPFTYAVHPPYAALGNLAAACDRDPSTAAPRDELRAGIDALAGLTAVDGATVITDCFDLLAFGVKIRPREGVPYIDQLLLAEPVEGYRDSVIHPAQLGGTRHLSAAQFVHDQRDASALVASVDGRFTVFAWSEAQGLVHAHRLEALLM